MLYEFNEKTYIKPFSNKLVEVEITKNGEEYDVKATKRILELTPKRKKEIVEITLKDAYEKKHKNEKKYNTI